MKFCSTKKKKSVNKNENNCFRKKKVYFDSGRYEL